MVDDLTEDELCELAEINNRLAQIVFKKDDKDVTEKEIAWMTYLELQGLIDQLSYTHFDENNEIIPSKFEEEKSRADDFRD